MSGNHWRDQPRDGKGRWTEGPPSVQDIAGQVRVGTRNATGEPTYQTDTGGTISASDAARVMFGSAGRPPRRSTRTGRSATGGRTYQTDTGGTISAEEAARIMFGPSGRPPRRGRR